MSNLFVMCGIIGIVSRRTSRPIPQASEIIAALDGALVAAEQSDVERAAATLTTLDRELRGLPGLLAIVDQHSLIAEITARLDLLDAAADKHEREIESAGLTPEELEVAGADLIAWRDALWSLRRDRLRNAAAVADLAGRGATESAYGAYLSIQQTLSALDRLEVRGRDSAGIHLFVTGHELAADDPSVLAEITSRSVDPTFQSGSVRFVDGTLSFVYKAAAEIGELGDNSRVLRTAIGNDSLLRRAVASPEARVAVLCHTRWASVGIISEPNAHPVNSEEVESSPAVQSGPYVVAALNGDVDNHAELRVEHGLRVHQHITTDAKVIPTMVSRLVGAQRQGQDAGAAQAELVEAFRRTVTQFDGSVAVGAMSADDPGTMLLALHGSGQGLYVGLADDRFIVASEPYGVVEEADRALRLDGEHGGEIVVLSAAEAGTVAGLRRLDYSGTDHPVTDADLAPAAVSTRDIDRGDAPHFLLKEISEAPRSFAKTLRGKIVSRNGELHAFVGERTLTPEIATRLASGKITRVRVIGQGTAAVAGQSAAEMLDALSDGLLDVDAITATELSGFHLTTDMSDTLVIAVSQSGTTTDTNRTVDLVRSRGGAVIGIVNRRASDLVDKADGILYTSDGRDVEMSVASTKAFYAQVAAGALLACAVSAAAGTGSNKRRHEVLTALSQIPEAMNTVLAKRDEIAEVARRFAPPKRYWAVVGNGPNRVAAEEVRIKLSELCYKSIASDVTEDKKHIDLSAEPLILVCAAGLQGGTADDVAKETAIFRAHKATAIVVANEGDTRYSSAATISVPPVDPLVGFILSAMVGHLFGYEAALAIDASARPLREARELIEDAVNSETTADEVVEIVTANLAPLANRFFDGLRNRIYDGQLEASTSVRLSMVLLDAMAANPIESYARSSGKIGSPLALIDELVAALTAAIEELTRPVDAIKHQAKTVTVGISRNDEGLMDRPLVIAALDAGAGRDVLAYRTLKVLAALDPAVADVVGFTRYHIDGDSITIVEKGGLARELTSRAESDHRLVGTKHRVAESQEVLVARGRRDNRTVIFVPEVKNGAATGISLLHVKLRDHLDAATMRSVLQGYDDRYQRLVDWVTETEGDFDEKRLGELPVAELLIDPISATADRWRNLGPAST